MDTFEKVPRGMPFIASVNLKDSSITFVDAETNSREMSWQFYEPISGACLLPDQDHLAVYGKEMDAIHIFSLSEGKQTDIWPTGEGIVNMSLLKGGNRLVLVDQTHDEIRLYSLDGKEINAKKVGNQPNSVLEYDGKLYVSNFYDTKLSVLDSRTLQNFPAIGVEKYSSGMAIEPGGRNLWVGGHGAGSELEQNVHIYSLATGKLVARQNAPTMPVKILTIKDSIFIISHGNSTIYKWEASDKSVQALKVGVNPFEIGTYREMIVVASYDNNRMYMLNSESIRIQKTIKTGKGPFQVVVRES
ncbi:YncE family protein [Bacillus testis]|uniref:YncE family protein n=1 Tax=Bacillus testis TaxID=1622072 RepID=UPI00067F649D|nr:hypothetical protein [Bacillus testis]